MPAPQSSAVDVDGVILAIMRALFPLVRSAAQPNGVFKLLDHWAGEVAQGEELHQAVLNSLPACLVAFEGEVDVSSERTKARRISGGGQFIARGTYTVLVCVTDVRGASATLTGQAKPPTAPAAPMTNFVGPPGAYRLKSLVEEALCSLEIEGLYRGEHLFFLDAKPYHVQRGSHYVLAVRFTADRVLPDAPEPTTDAVAFNRFTETLNREGTVDDAGTTPDPDNPLQNPRVLGDMPIDTE